MNELQLLRLLVAIAKVKAGGHFTIMKFTTNWRVQIHAQQFYGRDDIVEMPEGDTFEEAVIAAIEEITE